MINNKKNKIFYVNTIILLILTINFWIIISINEKKLVNLNDKYNFFKIKKNYFNLDKKIKKVDEEIKKIDKENRKIDKEIDKIEEKKEEIEEIKKINKVKEYNCLEIKEISNKIINLINEILEKYSYLKDKWINFKISFH
jgi:predicted  nucleic acid-binding Zn-ribbon protein